MERPQSADEPRRCCEEILIDPGKGISDFLFWSSHKKTLDKRDIFDTIETSGD